MEKVLAERFLMYIRCISFNANRTIGNPLRKRTVIEQNADNMTPSVPVCCQIHNFDQRAIRLQAGAAKLVTETAEVNKYKSQIEYN